MLVPQGISVDRNGFLCPWRSASPAASPVRPRGVLAAAAAGRGDPSGFRLSGWVSLRLRRMAPGVGSCWASSGSGSVCPVPLRATVCAALTPALPGVQRLRKSRGRFPAPGVCGLAPALDPVVDISVLDHAVSVLVRDDDVIENENPDPVQKALNL